MTKRILLTCAVLLALAGASPAQQSPLRKQPLAQPQTFNGVTCKTAAFFDASGRMRSCRLALDTIFSGTTIPRDSVVRFDEQGHMIMAFLSRETQIQKHAVRGNGAEWMTSFYPNGKLKVAWLQADEVIDGMSCRHASIITDITGGRVAVHFYENGRLRQCEASKEFAAGNCLYRMGDTIRVAPDGSPVCPER